MKIKCACKISTIYGILKRQILMNAFFNTQFNYCSLMWMCCNHSFNNKINQCDVCALRTKIKKLHFEDLLQTDRSVYTHHQNIKFLAN